MLREPKTSFSTRFEKRLCALISVNGMTVNLHLFDMTYLGHDTIINEGSGVNRVV